MQIRRPPWLRELLWVVATAVIALGVTIVDLELWKMAASVPLFGSSGDNNFYLASVKGVVEHGWFTRNPDLAAPFGQSNFDFATSFGDTLHYVVIRALAIPLDDPVFIVNVFFIVSFPLVAVSAYVVLRDLGAARPAAVVMGVLFAFLPYHLLRNQGHLFLSAYYAVPLGVWLVVTVAEGRTLLDRRHRRRTATTLAVCAVVASASNYYAIFTMLALVLVVPVVALAWRSRTMAVQGLLVLAAIGTVFALCHAPAVVHIWQNGSNEAVGKRAVSDSELYALKLTHMVIPRPGHRIGLLGRSGERYAAQDPLRSEGFAPSLGIVATIGLLGALVVALITGLGNRSASLRRRRICLAGALALACFVVGTVGGISSIIAFELTSQIRAWNRLSIFIAFASLLAAALALTRVGDRMRARGRPEWVFGVLAGCIGVLGLLDQTSPRDAPAYAANNQLWGSDEKFVSAMEARLPPNTAVLQLPYVPYPESGSMLGMRDYDLIRGYLHSTRLRWSYGAMKGRPTDWLDDAQALTAQELAAAAATAGFGAVYVDRAGYPDNAAALSTVLGKLTGSGPTGVSPDGRLQFFDLRPVATRIAAKTTPAVRSAVAKALTRPVAVSHGSGFSFQEVTSAGTFRRAYADSEMELQNPLDRPRRARLTMRLSGPGPQPSVVTMRFPDGSRRTVTVTSQGLDFVHVLTVPPGGGTLRLHTVGPAATPAPDDKRRGLRLSVSQPRLRDELLSPENLAPLVDAAV